jgi:transposase
MSGKFEGLTDEQWKVLEPLFPRINKKRGCAHKHVPWRNVLNATLWVLITGARWCDIPAKENFGSKSSSHRWLGRWQEDGTWDRVLEEMLKNADLKSMLSLERLAADGFFFSRQRRRRTR